MQKWNCQVSESVRSGGPTGGCCSLFLKHMTVSNQVEQSSNEVAIWPWFLKERNEHSTQIVYQYINRIIFLNVGMLTRVLAWTQTFTLLLEIGKLTWNMTEKTREPRLFAFLYPTSNLLLDPKWTQNYWNWFHKERDSSLAAFRNCSDQPARGVPMPCMNRSWHVCWICPGFITNQSIIFYHGHVNTHTHIPMNFISTCYRYYRWYRCSHMVLLGGWSNFHFRQTLFTQFTSTTTDLPPGLLSNSSSYRCRSEVLGFPLNSWLIAISYRFP